MAAAAAGALEPEWATLTAWARAGGGRGGGMTDGTVIVSV